MLIVFTGNGKGKTTAGLGQMLRTIGRGKRALMIQFIKGPWKSGEDESYKRLMPDLEIRKMGLGFVGILGDPLPRAKHKEAAVSAVKAFEKELASKKWSLIVLDEINVAVGLKLLSATTVLKVIKKIPLETFVILTGRDAPASFIKAAHLVLCSRKSRQHKNRSTKTVAPNLARDINTILVGQHHVENDEVVDIF